ncbi:MAG: ABC transporter permease [Micromonosporaceae bacterium]
MSTTTLAPTAVTARDAGYWTRARKSGVSYLVLGLAAAAIFGALAPGGSTARFVLSETAGGAGLPVPGPAGAIGLGLLAAAAGAALLTGAGARWFGWLTGVALVGLLGSFMCWQVSAAPAGRQFMPMIDIAHGTVIAAVPLIFGALAGVLCERTGVINVAIEGQFVIGAFAAAMVTTLAASVWFGLLAAAIAGLLLAALLAVFSIRYLVDQVVLGVILIALGVGLTGFLYERVMQSDQDIYNSPTALPKWRIPLLSEIPILGPVLFRSSILVYLALLLVVVVQIGLFQTRWGLRVRSVGEHPQAADTVGVRVLFIRYRNVLLAGVVAGIGGSYFVLENGFQFTKGITAGKGFIALAALIFGRWSPVGALFAALFFGFADKLSVYLQSVGSEIPSQFLSMTPYLLTILAVAGFVGRVRAPAADGKPYVKG